MVKQRKVPLRKCVITKEMKPKKDLIRIVRDKEGNVSIDLTGKKNGRGAYLTKDVEVVAKAEQSDILKRHLDAQIDPSIYEELKKLVGHHEEK